MNKVRCKNCNRFEVKEKKNNREYGDCNKENKKVNEYHYCDCRGFNEKV